MNAKPCPFCGEDKMGVNHHKEKPDDGLKPRYIHTICCNRCGAQGPWESTKRRAMRIWNKRQPAGEGAKWLKEFGPISIK